MKLPRRNFLHLAAGVAALSGVSRIARAQAYPTRPVRVIVGFPPGGGFFVGSRAGSWVGILGTLSEKAEEFGWLGASAELNGSAGS